MIVVGTSALKYFGAVTEAKDHDVGSTLYIGENPVYTPTVNDLGMVVGHTKVTKGIPFVQVR